MLSLVNDGCRWRHPDGPRQSIMADHHFEIDETVPVGIADHVSLLGQCVARHPNIDELERRWLEVEP